LHRAFSIFDFDRDDRLLLQRRALGKYHSAGLWSNTCCSHPRPGEDPVVAAHRRLREEMGFDCALDSRFAFVYRADFDNGLIEHEYDHVLVGRFDGDPIPDDREVGAWKWETIDAIHQDVTRRPDAYTVWFKVAFEELTRRTTWERRAVMRDRAREMDVISAGQAVADDLALSDDDLEQVVGGLARAWENDDEPGVGQQPVALPTAKQLP